ncbi:APC family permease [Conexibacter arvalis]|uniref:Amino acid transporter n=1 Tax=Conexibacter arvalis TaxID=912552 RepID=A0A840I8H2_9ACTN|nr:APC family permease [Conexibacter arvalis]MBB4660571.1 amino acid transporter [Conexibacter arvalis]
MDDVNPSVGGALPRAPRRTLMQNAIAYPGMVFMIVAITAPLTTIASSYSLSLGFGVGPGTIALTIAMAAVLAIFAAGYVAISRHVVNAGASYAFVAYGLGRRVGAATAMVLFIAYNLAAASMTAGAGYFAVLFGQQYLSLDLPWWVYAGGVWAVVAACGFRGLLDTKRVIAVLSCVGFAILLAVGIAVLVQDHPTTPSVGVGTWPSTGAIAFTLAMIAVSFAGFESVASYGEETGQNRNIARAIYTALAVLCLIYVFSTWSLIAAFDDVQAVAGADPGLVLPLAAETYLGSWAGPLIAGSAVLSFAAGAVAWHNAAVRYMFAFGRSGLLPTGLSRVNQRGVPVVAVATQAVVIVAVIAPFAIAGFDPLTGLFPAVAGVNTVAYVFGLMMLSVSVFASSVRGRLGDASYFVGRVAPVVSTICFLVILGCIVANYDSIVGSDSLVIKLAPAILVVGAVAAAWAERRRSPAEAPAAESRELATVAE